MPLFFVALTSVTCRCDGDAGVSVATELAAVVALRTTKCEIDLLLTAEFTPRDVLLMTLFLMTERVNI